MNRKRLIAAIFYVAASAAMLWCVWIGLQRPLPWKWELRRTERAMLLEPVEVLYHDRNKGVTVAANDDFVVLQGHTKKDTELILYDGDVLLFPVEDGAGAAVWGDFFGFVLYLCGYETSGQAVWANADLDLFVDGRLFSSLNQTAKNENGAFLFRLAEGNCTFTGTKWPNEGLRDVGFLSRYGVLDTNWSYHLTMTFYDEENHVTAIHEIGGGNHEDR